MIEYSNRLGHLCNLLPNLVDRIDQVTSQLPLGVDHFPVETVESKSAKEHIERIHDVSGFFHNITLPRLREMHHRAKLGVWLLKQVEERQHRLRLDVDRVMFDGWVSDSSSSLTSLLYIPPIEELERQLAPALDWITDELVSLNAIANRREFVINQSWDERREVGSRCRSDFIWSRWNLRDQKQDPMGKEAFCWP